MAEGVRSGDDPDAFDDTLPDPNTFLDKFTKCKQLVERFRENPNTSNKTPLAILHEYATRLNLEVPPPPIPTEWCISLLLPK